MLVDRWTVFIVIGLAVVAPLLWAVPASVAAQGPVASYGWSEGSGTTVADSTGNGHTGTFYGAAAGWTSAGYHGNGLLMGSSAQLGGVLLAHPDGFDGITVGTIEGWIKPVAVPGYAWRMWFDARGPNKTCVTSLEMAVWNKLGAGVITTNAWGGALSGGCEPPSFHANVVLSNPTGWHHIAYVVNGSGNALYVDGQLQTLTYIAGLSSTKFFLSTTGQYSVGTAYDIGGADIQSEQFVGTIDDVRIYDRALSQAEIQADMVVPVAAATSTPTGARTATRSATKTPVLAASPTPLVSGCAGATVIPASGGVFTGTTSGVSTLTGPCSVTNNSPEQVFQWTPAISGTALIETCGSATKFDTVAYVRSGNCTSGAAVGCNDDTLGCPTGDGTGSDRHGSRVTWTASAGQTYFIIVDGFNTAHGAFTLRVVPPAGTAPTASATATRTAPRSATPTPTRTAQATRSATKTPVLAASPTPLVSGCAGATVIPASGGVFTGTTSGVSTLTGPCSVTNNSPEQVFQWTPAISGTALIETCGNATKFDTVAYVRSGNCTSGAAVGCNDDTLGCLTGDGTGSDRHGSRVTWTASAGQTYFIIVDGFNTAHGAFTLRVVPPA